MAGVDQDRELDTKPVASRAHIVNLCGAFCEAHDVRPTSCTNPSNLPAIDDVSAGQAPCGPSTVGVGVGAEEAVLVRTAGGARVEVAIASPALPSPAARRLAPDAARVSRRAAQYPTSRRSTAPEGAPCRLTTSA